MVSLQYDIQGVPIIFTKNYNECIFIVHDVMKNKKHICTSVYGEEKKDIFFTFNIQ